MRKRVRRENLLPWQQAALDQYDRERLRFRTRLRANGCHEWTGKLGATKCPLIGVGKKQVSARQMAWHLAGKPALKPKQQLRVTCGNAICINPEHCFPHPR